jgi:rubredoxin
MRAEHAASAQMDATEIARYGARSSGRQDVKYRCTVCGHIYDPELGDPAAGIPPGTPFEAISETWICPDSGAGKADFEPFDG